MSQRKFFISYRREDAPTAAHVICERLVERFGEEQVFFDVDSIPLGCDFHQFLTEQVNDCQVLVAVIGRRWLDMADEQGRRRLDQDDDFVRIEIEAALERNIPVVPVLVEGARLPRPADLPAVLRRLARRNAAEVRLGAMFRQQLELLVQKLEQTVQSLAIPSAQVIAAPVPASLQSNDPSASKSPSKVVTNSVGMNLVEIPAGDFEMGSAKSDRDNERPVHRVHISQRLWLGKYPVTNAQYAQFMKAAAGKVEKPSYWDDRRFNQPEQPVVGVSWNDARAFCEWAGCRLPTEAEWEYACRAGTSTEYSFGDDEGMLGEFGWFNKNSGGQTQPVGTKRPNAWDLYDMHGNVWEWCQDWYGEYTTDPQTDPTGPQSGPGRVLRGGSWSYVPRFCRSAFRGRYQPESRDNDIGFRVART